MKPDSNASYPLKSSIMDAQPMSADQSPHHPPLEQLALEPLLIDESADPAQTYERLRSRYGPVVPVDALGVPAWLVIGYPQVLEVMRDQRGIWSKRIESWRAYAEGRVPEEWPLMSVSRGGSVVYRDGADLTRLRGAWSAALQPFQDRTRPQARALEAAVHRYADDLITAMTEGGPAAGQTDLVARYSRPLPLMALNRLFGFGSDHGEELVLDMWRMLDAGPEAPAALARLVAALTESSAAKRATPGEDLPSYMLAAQPDMTVEEMARQMMLLVALVGDHTATLIANTVAEVLKGDTGARAGLAGGMIQEAVNRAAISSPPMSNTTLRWARADVRLGRYLVAAGDPVILSIAGAHTDPVFTAGHSSDAVRSSRAHLAWSAGPHGCMGRDLATTITVIAVERLFERFAALRLAVPPEHLPWRTSPLMRGLRALPVHYELSAAPVRPGPAAAAAVSPETAAQEASLARRVLRALRLVR